MRNVTQHKEHEPGFHLDLGNYARILWRKKYFLLVPLAIAFIVASVGVRFLVPEYESTSVIRVLTPSTSTGDVDQMMRGGGGRSTRDEKTKKQMETDLLGSNFLDELIKKPARQLSLLALFKRMEAEDSQIILATHSPLVINELEPEEVTIVTRTPERGTVCTPMTATTNFEQRKKVYALGELWLSYADGELERGLVGDGAPVEAADAR